MSREDTETPQHLAVLIRLDFGGDKQFSELAERKVDVGGVHTCMCLLSATVTW